MTRRSIYILLFLVAMGSSLMSLPSPEDILHTDRFAVSPSETTDNPSPLAFELRQLAVHNAGRIYLPINCGGFPGWLNFVGYYRDPETDSIISNGLFPKDKGQSCIFATSLWVGGIVGEDTLVSQAFDIYSPLASNELWPPDPEAGGVVRTGGYADDEFMAVYTDTVTDSAYVTSNYNYIDSIHTPLGIEITQTSYSWQDTLYDDFIIIEFAIENIGNNLIRSGWVGLHTDTDIYDTSLSYLYYPRSEDDASGILDTLLYENDPESRFLVPYAFDWDGDPLDNFTWDPNTSSRGAIAFALLGASIVNPTINFNWWIPGLYPAIDFGPRRVGTPENPFRPFYESGLGRAITQEDKYYLMSYPEIDYNELEMDIHDSTDGWIPSPSTFVDGYHDTRFLYSFGPFDLFPGDSVTFTVAMIGVDDFHVNPGDFDQYFDPEHPEIFQSHLDFTEMMIDLRRADSVYKSGYTVPHPGPPQGLHITEYNDAYVDLAWQPSGRPEPVMYYVNVKDTAYDDIWRHAFADPISDTVYSFQVLLPSHEYFFAVSLVDSAGRESDVSIPASVIPGRPHPPCSLTVALDSLTPVLSWRPYCDTSLMVYIIYRSLWAGALERYDSVSALQYYDYGAESGVQYNYKISAQNSMQLESSLIGPVSAMPMALNEGVLFYDMNYDNSMSFDPYHRRYVDRMVYAVQPVISMDYHDIEENELSFRKMSRYEVILFDCERRGGKFRYNGLDSISLYLSSGGRALFIVPNASITDLMVGPPRVRQYASGDFFYDILHLDSAITNGIALLESKLWGDLTGCRPIAADYPVLEADSAKLIDVPIEIHGYIPLAGCIYPQDDVEILYRYQSMYTDSILHEQVNGIAYAGDSYKFVLFNFQLSLMGQPSNIRALREALEFLGVDLTCGDVNDDELLDVGDAVLLIGYLFRGGTAPSEMSRADVNCDIEVDVGDALEIINVIFRDAAGLNCCR